MANDVIERGDIYFAYRPRGEQEQVHDIEEVQRLFVILEPSGDEPSRRLVIGRKHLPQPEEHERFWGFVDEVAARPDAVAQDLERRTYDTRTRGKRTQPEARPAGEGRYAIVRHGSHTHLTYERDPELLDQEGIEFVLIGAAHDVEEELDVRLDAEGEDVDSAEIFRRLNMPREKHPTEPLTKGEWR